MLIKKADRTQRYGVRDNSNLSESVKASMASARMYDQLTNSFLQLSDVATTSAINAEIRDATLEGELKGGEGVQQEDGAFKGYEPDTEIFKWDVASNKASKASFEAGVSSRASSTLKSLSKEVNGDKDAYQTVSKRLLEDALKNVDDPNQRQHITNSYAKSYNQNMGTVSTRYIKVEGDKAKLGWEAGRISFEDDYATKSQEIDRLRKDVHFALKDGDMEEADRLIDKIKVDENSLKSFANARRMKAEGALQLGVITTEEINRDTHADIVKAITASSVQSYAMAETEREKNKIIRDIQHMPESKSEGNELLYMSPQNKQNFMKAVEDQELQDQKMWKSNIARSDKEYTIDKKESLDTINLNMLDDELDDQTLTELGDALSLGYVDEKEYQDYRNRILNGSPVTRDTWSNYTELANNVETYNVSDIANMQGLTDATKKKFIGERLAWEEEGNEWMTLPAYKGGKDVIRDAYGFPEKSLFISMGNVERDKYTEMNELQYEYRQRVQESVDKGERYNGIAIAEELIKVRKTDMRSKLFGNYVDNKVLTTKDLRDAKKIIGTNLKSIMETQFEQFPDTKFESTIDESVKAEEAENPNKKDAPKGDKERLKQYLEETRP